MPDTKFFVYLLVMALTTYLIRLIPFMLFNRKIENPRIKAFFEYIPYTVLSSMTFPAILYSSGSVISAAAGTVVALILAFCKKSLLVVAIGACISTLLAELILRYI